MIITNCPYCENHYFIDMRECDYFKVDCENCKKEFFVEMTSFEGETITSEEFWEKYPNAKLLNE